MIGTHGFDYSADSCSNIQLSKLPLATNYSTQWVTAGDGATANSTSALHLRCIAGGSCATWLNEWISPASGATIKFTYRVFGSARNVNAPGFALVFQDVNTSARDGSYQRLGYNIQRAFGVEFDYYNDATSETASNTPHVQIFGNSAGNFLPTPDYASTMVTGTGDINNCPTNTDCNVEITMSAINASNQITMSIKWIGAKTVTLTKTVTIPEPTDSSFRRMEQMLIGFTSSSGASQAAGVSIKNVEISTALTRIIDVKPVISGTIGVVNRNYTSPTPYHYSMIFSSCGHQRNWVTWETKIAMNSMQFEFTRPAYTNQCQMKRLEETVYSQGGLPASTYRQAFACEVPVPNEALMKLTYKNHANTSYGANISPAVQIRPGNASAATSEITHINDQPITSGTQTFVAGTIYKFTVKLYDVYGNECKWTGATPTANVSIRIPADDGSQSGSYSGTINADSTVTIDVLMQKYTESSIIELNVENVLSTKTYNCRVNPGPIHPDMLTLFSGHTTQYSAGQTVSIVVALYDQYGNRVFAANNNDINGLLLTLYPDGVTSCTANDANFVTCPTVSVVDSNAQLVAVPKRATAFTIGCRVNGVPCKNIQNTQVQIVAAIESAADSVLEVPAKAYVVGAANYNVKLSVYDQYKNIRTTPNTAPFALSLSGGHLTDPYTFNCPSTSTTGETRATCTHLNGAYQINIYTEKSNIEGYSLQLTGGPAASKVYAQAPVPTPVATGSSYFTGITGNLIAGIDNTFTANFLDRYGNVVREIPALAIGDQTPVWGVVAFFCSGAPGARSTFGRNIQGTKANPSGTVTATFQTVGKYTCVATYQNTVIESFEVTVVANAPHTLTNNVKSLVVETSIDHTIEFSAIDEWSNVASFEESRVTVELDGTLGDCKAPGPVTCSPNTTCRFTITQVTVSGDYVCQYVVKYDNVALTNKVVFNVFKKTQIYIFLGTTPFTGRPDSNDQDQSVDLGTFAAGQERVFYLLAYEEDNLIAGNANDIILSYDSLSIPPADFSVELDTSGLHQYRVTLSARTKGDNYQASMMFRGQPFEDNKATFTIVPGTPSLQDSGFDFATTATSFTACDSGSPSSTFKLAVFDSYQNAIDVTNVNDYVLECGTPDVCAANSKFDRVVSSIVQENGVDVIHYGVCHKTSTSDSFGVLARVVYSPGEPNFTNDLVLYILPALPSTVELRANPDCTEGSTSETCLCRAGTLCTKSFELFDQFRNVIPSVTSDFTLDVTLVPKTTVTDAGISAVQSFDAQGNMLVTYHSQKSGDYDINILVKTTASTPAVLIDSDFSSPITHAQAPASYTLRYNGVTYDPYLDENESSRFNINASMNVNSPSTITEFFIDFKDRFDNVWSPNGNDPATVVLSYDVSGLRADKQFNEIIPVAPIAKSMTGVTLKISNYLTKSGAYILNVTPVNTSLKNIAFTVVPGPATQFDNLKVDYNPTVIAGKNVQFRLRALDAQGNNVNAISTVTTLLQSFTMNVFSTSSVLCNNNQFSVTPLQDHGFTIKSVEHSARVVGSINDNEFIINFTTTKANSYNINGIRNVYAYYILNQDGIPIACANRYLVTFVPDVVLPVNSIIQRLPTSAIEAGSSIDMSIVLRDQYSNIIQLNEGGKTHSITVQTCDDTAITPVSESVSATALAYDITLPTSLAESVDDNLQFSVRVSEVDAEDGELNVAGALESGEGDTCFSIAIYHSYPNSINVVEPTLASGETIYTSLSGTPFPIEFSSADRFGNIIAYDNAAFGGSPEDFDVNDFYYRIQLRHTGRVIPTDDGGFIIGQEIFSYFGVQNTTAIDLTLDADAQHGYLLFPWAGRYEGNIRLFRRSNSGNGADTAFPSPIPLAAKPIVFHVRSPFCDVNQYFDDATQACVDNPTTAPVFTCLTETSPSTPVDVTAQQVTTCKCYDDMVKCSTANVCAHNISDCPVADEIVPPRVCPIGAHLCQDLYTCVDDAANCPNKPSPCPEGQVTCLDLTCVDSVSQCGSIFHCPSTTPFICPNNRCVDGKPIEVDEVPVNPDAEEDDSDYGVTTLVLVNGYCEALRPCVYPNTHRCPTDGACVESADQCSRPISCPEDTFLCSNGQCLQDVEDCETHSVCTNPDARYLCPNGNCVHDIMFCSTSVSCGPSKPLLCPDQITCVEDVSECTFTRSCPPERPYACSTGDCVLVPSQCPTATTCPINLPIRCSDNQCVATKDVCDSVATIECPHTTPIRCSDNSCVAHINLCPSPITCPVYRPVRCSTGECQTSIENCPSFDEENDPLQCSRFGFVSCPLSGFCVPHVSFCPTIRKCRSDEVRCPNGICFRAFDSLGNLLDNPCPDHALPTPVNFDTQSSVCGGDLIQCPIANAGVVCAPNKESCPGDIVCPPTSPIRCGDQTCRSSVEECSYIADTTTYPPTRVPCGDGSWAASQALCGKATTCPPQAPVKCADTTCRISLDDCPPVEECPSERPFKCADGSCQVSPWACGISMCQGDRSVRCPSSTSNNRCVSDISECVNVLDMNIASTFTLKSTFGTQCHDSSSVFESRLCPARICPVEAPYLCDNGACARSVDYCPHENSCPWDLPFFCKNSGTCVKSETACALIQAKTCGTIEDINPSTGEPETIQMELCDDGVCRHPDECFDVTYFGCPFDAPIRCADGTCVPRPTMTGADTVIKCKTLSDQHNACPPERPVRCRGGLCVSSSSRCPVYPVESQVLTACRAAAEEDSDSDFVPQQLMVSCDDGSCAFSYAECPIVKPCASNEYRCGDGSCKRIPCNPRNADCRARESFTVENYLGAECSGANTCPSHRPFRCQAGNCVQDVSQCGDQYPITLGRCCGTDFYDRGVDGNDIGSCRTASTVCIENVVRDGNTNGGCPPSAIRCPSGICALDVTDEIFDATSLCTAYGDYLDKINAIEEPSEDDDDEGTNPPVDGETDPDGEADEKVLICPFKCQSNGRCVQSLDQCLAPNSCPIGTPIKCANGKCVDDVDSCTTDECEGVICPGTDICVDEYTQCTLPNGCPAATPILCANGLCKKFGTSPVGATKHVPYYSTTPSGIDTSESCPLTITCDSFRPYVCFDGSCAISSDYCPPVINTCQTPSDEATCTIVCPFTLECKSVTRDADSGACNYSEMSTVCGMASCPSSAPFICPDGSCKSSISQCLETVYDVARTFECPTDKPFRCFNGACASKPFECIAMTALLNHGTVLEQSEGLTNTNVCDGGYVCPNGACVDPVNGQCDMVPACPFNSLRCWDGSCVSTTIASDGTIQKPTCPEQETCVGGNVRCADGSCRTNGNCPLFDGCPLSSPFACTWRPASRCTQSYDSCHSGSSTQSVIVEDEHVVAAASSSSGDILAVNMHQTLSSSKKYFTTHLAELYDVASTLSTADRLVQRMGRAELQMNTIIDLMKSQRLGFKQEYRAYNVATPHPNESSVLSCYNNCERDITVRPQSLLIGPHQAATIDVALNKNNLPRTKLSIQPATFKNHTEVHIYPVPTVLFDGTRSNDNVIDFTLPYNFNRPRNEDNIRTADVSGKYGATVLSSPFACGFKYNGTSVQPLTPVSVTSHVDLTRYSSGDSDVGPITTDTDFSCELQGTWDSAFHGCPGYITFNETDIYFNYDACNITLPDIENPGQDIVYSVPADKMSFNATFVSSSNPDAWIDSDQRESAQKICFQVYNSTRAIPESSTVLTTVPLRGQTVCWDFYRTISTLYINTPANFFVDELITVEALEQFAAIETVSRDTNAANTLLNSQLVSTAQCSSADATDAATIRKADICLGHYTQDYEWKCLQTSYEERTALPSWVSGMKPNEVQGGTGVDCSASAYAFLYVPLPPPTEIEDSFCFWCKYGWIILLCCIIFGVLVVIGVLLGLKFYRDRLKFKEEQAKLKELQDRAKELDEFAGGVGLADADGEIQMVANPLVLQMQELNKQLEEANQKLQTTSKQEEYEIQRLEQQRQRIYAEIARVDAELKSQNREADKPKRVDAAGPSAPSAGPSGPIGSNVPAGPVRAGPTPAGGPSPAPGASGPMAAPRRN